MQKKQPTRLKAFSNPFTMVLLFLIYLEQDLVTPVLLDAHFEAVDRRVGIILKLIRECLQATTTNASEVIFSHDDLYDSGYDAVENDKAFN